MSIQTELARITNAKSAIKTAIEGKGVTVPDGTLLDGMAALIESIEAGGGNVIEGTITPTQAGSLDVDLSGYGLNTNKRPRARYMFEDSGLPMIDKTHQTKRPIMVLQMIQDITQLNNISFDQQSYLSSLVYQNSGSNSYNEIASVVAGFWMANKARPNDHGFFCGYINDNVQKIYFYATEATDTYTQGIIVGRTYRWGLVF